MARSPKTRLSLLGRKWLENPLLFWSGLLTVLILVSSVAWYGLSSPYFVAANSSNDGSLPLWSYGAIALSCAVGCLMVSQSLNRDD